MCVMVGNVYAIEEYADSVYAEAWYIGMVDGGEDVFLAWTGGE